LSSLKAVFPALRTDGGAYWDGLFSQNPPVRELLDTHPDEIWIIQINPKETETEPRTVVEIADRRNELAGNLSLYQELHFIEEMNRLLDAGLLTPSGRYKHVVVRIIELSRSRTSRLWGPASKLDREPAFLRQLMDQGERQATSRTRGAATTPRASPGSSPTTRRPRPSHRSRSEGRSTAAPRSTGCFRTTSPARSAWTSAASRSSAATSRGPPEARSSTAVRPSRAGAR